MKKETEDIPLCSEAIIALGYTQSSLAGEYILSILKKDDFIYKKQCILALSKIPLFPIREELLAIFLDPQTPISSIETVLIALSSQIKTKDCDLLLDFLENKIIDNSSILNAALICLSQSGTEKEIDRIEEIETQHNFLSTELKNNAIDKVKLRSKNSLENTIQNLISAKTDAEIISTSVQLSEYPEKTLVAMLEIFENDISEEKKCALKVYNFNKNNINSDVEFIKNEKYIDLNKISQIARLHSKGIKTKNYFLCSKRT